MRNHSVFLKFALAAGVFAFATPSFAATLFDNGAANFGIFGDFLDCSNCRSSQGVEVYDDFTVAGGNWTVTGLFGRYAFDTGVPFLPTSATWSIRTGVSQGNSGTLLAGGTAALTLQSFPTPPNGQAVSYEQASIDIGPLILTPGTYWMALSPTSSSDEGFLIATDGTGGVDALNDGEAFAIGTFWSSMQDIGAYEQQFVNVNSRADFSYGVVGTADVAAAPEPGSAALLAGGLAMAASLRRKLAR